MRIPSFSVVVSECTQPHRLQNCKLVIDARNFFYDFYKMNALPHQYGAECDKYADDLKIFLTNHFTENKIECYFIFKGGTKNLEKKISDVVKSRSTSDYIHPVLVNDINVQVLDEMNIKYVFTEYEAKAYCIALAKEMSCPVLSFDVEFAFAGVQYIPYKDLRFKNKFNINFDKEQKTLCCKIFTLENLLQKFSIYEKDKLSFFIVITDLKVFPEHTFKNLYKSVNIPEKLQILQKLTRLLDWLSKTDSSTIMSTIINHAKESNVSEEEIREALNNARKIIEPDPLSIDSTIDAPTWFQKGVASNFIAIEYIDMYRSNKFLMYSAAPENVQTSLKIIKYAYDLLTNFRYDKLTVLLNHESSNSQEFAVESSVAKPIYEANECVFENGWDDIVSLRLFQHFMIQDNYIDFDNLKQVPSDAQLLFITLVYLHRNQSQDTTLSRSILLSYVMLGVVKVVLQGGNYESGYDQDQPTVSDCRLAIRVLDQYSAFTGEINDGLRFSLIEFQHCLQHFNYLNRLCGSPFTPTVYSKTFNATFVYNIREVADEAIFFNRLLEQAPSILNIFNRVITLYEELL